jgi:hypothetical protein
MPYGSDRFVRIPWTFGRPIGERSASFCIDLGLIAIAITRH